MFKGTKAKIKEFKNVYSLHLVKQDLYNTSFKSQEEMIL